MRDDHANKRFYKKKPKHLSAKPAEKVDKKKYDYKVVSAAECKDHGVVSPSDLLKFAIAKFDGERFVEAVAWFSSEKSAIKAVKNFPPKPEKVKKKKKQKVKKNQKKDEEVHLVFGYNTVKG